MASLEAFLIGGGLALLANAFMREKGVPNTPENTNRAKEAIASDDQLALDVAKHAGVDLGAIDAANPPRGNAAPQTPVSVSPLSELDLLGERPGSGNQSNLPATAQPSQGVTGPAPITGLTSPQPGQLDQDAIMSLAREVSGEEGTAGAGLSLTDIAALAVGGGEVGRQIFNRITTIRPERVGDAPFPGGPVFDVPGTELPGSQTRQIRGPNQGVVPTDQRSGTGVATGDVSNRPVTPSAAGPAEIPGSTRQAQLDAENAEDLIPRPPIQPTPTEQRVSRIIDQNETDEIRFTGEARGADVTEGLITIQRQDGRSVRAVEVGLEGGESVLVDLEGNIYSRRGQPTGQTVDIGQLAAAVESQQPRIAQILRSAARGL